MAITLAQQGTPAAGDTRTGCSGRSSTTQPIDRNRIQCTVNGTPGSNTVSVSCAASETDVVVDRDYSNAVANALDGYDWGAGTWTWRYNITTSNMNLTLDEVHICQLSSALVNKATIGSATGLAISLSSTGVKSGNITGIAVTPAAGDIVGVFYVFTNGAMSQQAVVRTADQNITCPFSVAASSAIKSLEGLARASVKSVHGLAIASLKSAQGLT